ncbi:MAG: tetratricopeptide repeat protein [Magnetococcales bacterium]|nr:tetratricopeptide repeat protein [Magnetococcales bacterium]
MKIIAFFSCQAGVGRTALITELAAYWASLGNVVGLVDMDLAAPGLTGLPLINDLAWPDPAFEGCGVSDLIAYFNAIDTSEEAEALPLSALFREVTLPNGQKWGRTGQVWALGAGSVRSGEICLPLAEELDSEQVQAFYRDFRKRVKNYVLPDSGRAFDYVLVDFRTGYPDLLALMLGNMADQIVLMSGLTSQNLSVFAETLQTLREEAIPFGAYARDVVVALSPLQSQINICPLAMQALEKGVRLSSAYALVPPEDIQVETTPACFVMPYDARLAGSDLPLLLNRQDLPYVRTVMAIAEQIDGATVQHTIQKTQYAMGRCVGVSFTGDDAAVAGLVKSSKKYLDSADSRAESTEFQLILPRWYWPLLATGQKDRIAEVRAGLIGTLPQGVIADKDGILDLLAGSVAFSVGEKKRILALMPDLSQSQLNALIDILDRERQRHAVPDGSDPTSRMVFYLHHQIAWADRVILNQPGKIIKPLMDQAAQRKGSFPSWEDLPIFWVALAELFRNDPPRYEQAMQEAFKMDTEDASAWNRLGIRLAASGEYDQAAGAFIKSIDQDRNDPEAWSNFGRLLHERLDRPSDAEKVYRQALALDESLANAWQGLGNLYQYTLNRPEQAESAYRKALESDPNNADTWHGLGNLLKNHLNRYEESEKAYRKAIALDGSLAYPWYGLAKLLHYKLDRAEESEAAYQTAIELEPRLPNYHQGLANLYQHVLDRPEASEAAYQQALELDPKYADAWHGLGKLYQNKLDRPEDSEAVFKKAIELDPNYAHPWYTLGNLYQYKLHRPDASEEAYIKIIEADGSLAAPWHGLGNLYQYKLGRPEEAEAAYRKSIELDASEVDPWNKLGNLLKNHFARYAESESAYQHALTLKPSYASAWNGLGNLLQDHLGRLDEAEAAYRKSIELDPRYAYPWHGMGLLYWMHRGHYSAAKKLIEKGLSLADDENINATLQRDLGFLYQHADENGMAIAHLDQSLSGLRPDLYRHHCHIQIILEACLNKKGDQSADILNDWLIKFPKDANLHFAAWLQKTPLDAMNTQSVIDTLSSHYTRFEILTACYRISGFRADLRLPLRRFANKLYGLPAEKLETFKDVALPKEILDRYKPFVARLSIGCGDPNDMNRFFKEDEPVLDMPG